MDRRNNHPDSTQRACTGGSERRAQAALTQPVPLPPQTEGRKVDSKLLHFIGAATHNTDEIYIQINLKIIKHVNANYCEFHTKKKSP